MKLKNVLALALITPLFLSLYAQDENIELKMINELPDLQLDYEFEERQEIYNTVTSDEFFKSTITEIDPNLAQQLQNVLDEAIVEYNIKGLSAALSTPNGDIWKGVSGISHDAVEVTTDMLFGVASVTKTFIATIIMQLYEEDSLKLSDSIYKWLPPYDNIDSTATIRQLLNHTSGIYNVSDHPGYIDSVFVAGSRIWTPEEILETFVLEPSFPPGTDWEYSNTNFKLLGMIIEEITGNDVVTELHNRITIPLELNSTFLFPDEGYEGVRSHVWFPLGNDTLDVTHLVDTTAFSAAWTSGGILSTAEDLVLWSKGLFEGEILDDTTLALMKVPAPYSNGYYGLGTSIRYLYQLPLYGHSGNYIYRSQLFYVPFDSLCISVLSNQQLPSIQSLWYDLYFAYKDFLSSQFCLPDGITFSSQAQIDSFQVNHPFCIEVEGDVTISGVDITNLNGLSVLTSIGGDLFINGPLSSNQYLTNLSGLDSLASIGGNLTIGYNSALISLSGLDHVKSIGGDLLIYGTDLTDLTGLEGLTSIEGDLIVGKEVNLEVYAGNTELINLVGLNNLSSIGGGVFIKYNWSLTSLTGLEGLTFIPGDLFLDGGDGLQYSLMNLTGLDNVSSIGGSLRIDDNDGLTSLTGLENVTSIDGDISIRFNETLSTLTGLENISAGSIFDLTIIYNDSLSECDVQSICDYIISPGGEIEINNNAPGCNSQEEVEEACLVSVTEEIIASDNYSINPNPVNDIATISSEEISSIELYDMMGILITRQLSNKMDMSNLKPGIYFIIGFDEKGNPLYKGKIVKN